MSYHNYRERKKEGLASLIKKIVKKMVVNAGEVKEQEEVTFQLQSKRFSEISGKESPYPEIMEIDVEALKKEKALLQGFIKDIDALLADVQDQN